MSTRTVKPGLLRRCLAAWLQEQARGETWRRDEDMALLLTYRHDTLPCEGHTLREVAEHGRAWPKM